MLRLIVTRILTAIPVLVILSIATFGIIKAQPGDYADYLKSTYMSQGHMSNETPRSWRTPIAPHMACPVPCRCNT